MPEWVAVAAVAGLLLERVRLRADCGCNCGTYTTGCMGANAGVAGAKHCGRAQCSGR